MRTNKKRTRTQSTDGPPRNPPWRTHAAKSSALVARCCQEIGTSDLLSGAYELEDKKAPYSPFRRPEQGTPTMLRRVYTCRQIRSGGGPKAEARLAPFPQMGFLRIAVTPGSRGAANAAPAQARGGKDGNDEAPKERKNHRDTDASRTWDGSCSVAAIQLGSPSRWYTLPMKALVISRLGDPDVLEVRQVPDPVPTPGQELVEGEAGGINFADIMSAQGGYPGTPKPPLVAGREFCGIRSDGQRVMGYAQWGAFAERIAASSALVWPVPQAWSTEAGAAFPVNYFTAYFGAPCLRHGPHQCGQRGDALGERAPLRVSHDALPVAANTAKFASGYQRGFRCPGITALRTHDVGEVDPAGLAFYQFLSRSGDRIRNLPYLEHVGIA